MKQIGIVGLGYWGPNYLRVFNEMPDTTVKWCCDLDQKNLNKIAKLYPRTMLSTDFRDLAKDPDLDAVVIVTPVTSHYPIARHFLSRKKHVFMEKPFTARPGEAQRLIDLAEKQKRVLMVGHVYLYNPGVIYLKELIDAGKLGEVYYIKTERIGLGPIRKHASALWDLATHDISIVLHLLGNSPDGFFAKGGSYLQQGIEDFVDVNLHFPGNVYCTIYASWFAPEKVRKVTVVGSKGMVVFDDVNKQEMIKLYERRVDRELLNSTPDFHDHQSIVVTGDVHIPNIRQSEPLRNQAGHFLECMTSGRRPLSDGDNGLQVVSALARIQKLLNRR